MKVIALRDFAGMAYSCTEGETYDLPDEAAKQHIKEGLVKPADEPKAKPKPKAKK